MPVIDLNLPLPPSVNALHAGTGAAKHRQKHYREWLRDAGWEIMSARPKMPIKALPPRCLYRIRARWPQYDSADADNRLKALVDLLVGLRVTPDDKLLDGGSFGRSPLVPPGRCLVRVWSI